MFHPIIRLAKQIGAAAALAIFVLAFPISAMADTTTAVPVVSASTSVDFAGLLNLCISVGVIVLTFGGPLAVWIMNKTKASAAAKAFVENVFTLGASLVATKFGSVHIASASLNVKNIALADGLNYAMSAATQSLTKLGYDPSTPEGKQHIIDAITARVPAAQAAAGISASPALTATFTQLEPLVGQAISDPHTITTGQLVQAATALTAALPADDKAKALAAAESLLPSSLTGVLTVLSSAQTGAAPAAAGA